MKMTWQMGRSRSREGLSRRWWINKASSGGETEFHLPAAAGVSARAAENVDYYKLHSPVGTYRVLAQTSRAAQGSAATRGQRRCPGTPHSNDVTHRAASSRPVTLYAAAGLPCDLQIIPTSNMLSNQHYLPFVKMSNF